MFVRHPFYSYYSIEKNNQLVGLASSNVLYPKFKEVEGMTVAEFCETCPKRKPPDSSSVKIFPRFLRIILENP